ncbi:PASTA domain-containing protein [Ferruginibacter sp.]
MFKFITSRPLWVNVLVAILLAALLVFFVLKTLGWVTQHGKYLTVPAVLGKKTEDAIKLLEKEGFDVQIQDSVFTDTASRGVVLKQLPDGNATVKINRTVFLTVNRVVPPMIEMPKLEGQSLSFALDMLQRSHLRLEDTIFKPSFELGSVLEQQYKGVRIPEKVKLQWGSRITLVIGSGLGGQQMMVPSLLGMTFREAKAYLQESGLNLGAVLPRSNVRDTANAFVYKQNPERFDEEKKPRYIQSGQIMDVWISVEMPRDSVDNN